MSLYLSLFLLVTDIELQAHGEGICYIIAVTQSDRDCASEAYLEASLSDN